MENEQVTKLRGMIKSIEPVGQREISIPASFASGYLLALHDAGLVSEEEWIRYDHWIDEKAGTFIQSHDLSSKGGCDKSSSVVLPVN